MDDRDQDVVLDRKKLIALATVGGDALVRELLRNFLTEAAGDLARLRTILSVDGVMRFIRIAHGVRLASQHIGAASLALSLIDLEQAARALTLDDFRPADSAARGVAAVLILVRDAEGELDRVRTAAEAWLEECETPAEA